MNPPKAITLIWLDSACSHGQHDREEAEGSQLLEMHTAALLVAEHPDRFVIAMDWMPATGEFRDVSVIPRNAVLHSLVSEPFQKRGEPLMRAVENAELAYKIKWAQEAEKIREDMDRLAREKEAAENAIIGRGSHGDGPRLASEGSGRPDPGKQGGTPAVGSDEWYAINRSDNIAPWWMRPGTSDEAGRHTGLGGRNPEDSRDLSEKMAATEP